jgi:hypothetical protein
MYAIAFVTDVTQNGSLAGRLRKLGITGSRWRAWLREPEFRSTFNSVANQLFEDNFHEVERGLFNSATKGDITAIKFAYEITGRWDPNAKNAMDVAAVLGRVVEIISKHVTDPTTLLKIAGEMEMLSSVALPGVTGKIAQKSIEGTILEVSPVADNVNSAFEFVKERNGDFN